MIRWWTGASSPALPEDAREHLQFSIAHSALKLVECNGAALPIPTHFSFKLYLAPMISSGKVVVVCRSLMMNLIKLDCPKAA